MSLWDEHITRYPTKLSLTPEELDHLSVLFEDHFAANIDGHCILFARWGSDALYSQGQAHSWRSLDDNSPVYPEILRKAFPNEEHLQQINVYKGTGIYQGKEIKWDKNRVQWSYLNNRTVHFNNSATSSAEHSSPDSPAEDDTARVEEILQRTETTVTSAIQKLKAPSNPPSRPGTPSSRPKTPAGPSSLQTSSVLRTTQSTSTVQPTSSLPTPPVSKGKAPAVSRFASSAFQAPGPAPPPLPAPLPPPPGPNPPNPPAAMAQQNQTH